MFTSKDPRKVYCNLKCYTTSATFLDMLAKNRQKIQGPDYVPRHERTPQNCVHCGVEYLPKRPGQKRKFCSQSCYRLYMAERYDRWIANPETIALPQAYDEFLSRNELPCLVDGCDWIGKHLSIHMNFAHGVPAAEFKRAAGFNLTTGVISADLRATLEARVGYDMVEAQEALRAMQAGQEDAAKHDDKPNYTGYRSLEGKEHFAKGIAEMRKDEGPDRTCLNCGVTFQQTITTGRTKYCSPRCGRMYRYKQPAGERTCLVCGEVFIAKSGQLKHPGPKVCSFSCRQKRAGHIGRGTWPGDAEWQKQHDR